MKIIIFNEATEYSPNDKLARLVEEILLSKGIKPLIVHNAKDLVKLVEAEVKMKEQFNLSDKVRVGDGIHRDVYLEIEDVKEFIRRLKVLILNKEHYDLEREIDKLAGSKLVEAEGK